MIHSQYDWNTLQLYKRKKYQNERELKRLRGLLNLYKRSNIYFEAYSIRFWYPLERDLDCKGSIQAFKEERKRLKEAQREKRMAKE